MQGRKRTGSYYTAHGIADYLVGWAMRRPDDSFLEPSFGDGVFLDALMERKRGAAPWHGAAHAVEMQHEVYSLNRDVRNGDIAGYCRDFMRFNAEFKVHAVVGNPPYVSLKNLSKEQRGNALVAASALGVNFQTSASLWAPFVVHATSFLEQGGRIAFVLPYELTYVKYAYPLWEYLSRVFSDISVVRIHEDFFPDVDVEAVLFLADGYGGQTDCIAFQCYDTLKDLFQQGAHTSAEVRIDDIIQGKKPFMKAMVDASCLALLQKLRTSGTIVPSVEYCKFRIGYVSADKAFFHPSLEIRERFHIPNSSLLKSICNAKELNGGTGIGAYIGPDHACSHLYYPVHGLSDADSEYIAHGVDSGVDQRYKCRTRKPWYLTPSVIIPDVILTVFGDTPKLVANMGGYAVSNSLLEGTLSGACSAEAFVCSWYNSLTLLSIELNVHSLGGGVLVLIPGETDRIEMVTPAIQDRIDRVFGEIDRCIKLKGVKAAYTLGDELVLKGMLGMTDDQLREIREAIDTLQFWRIANNRQPIPKTNNNAQR